MHASKLTHKPDTSAIARQVGSKHSIDAARIPSDRLPILVTGASGVTGFNAFHYLAQRYPGQVFGQRPNETFRLNDEGIIAFNLEEHDSTLQVIKQHGIKSVLSCGGNCALKSCELDPAMAQNVNVGGITSLVKAIRNDSTCSDIRLVHLSVDMVFSGTRGGDYLESDPTDPVSVYGRTMVESEQVVQSHLPDACLLRVSLPMGVSFNVHAGAIDWIKSRFVAGRPATLYYDEVRTPTYVQCLNVLFEFMLSESVSGLFHAGGSRNVSLFEIAQVINRIGGYDPGLLRGCFRIEAGPIPPRAGNVVMNSDKLRNLLSGHQRWNFPDELTLMGWPYNLSHYPKDRLWHYQRQEFPDQGQESPDSIGPGSFHKLVENLYERPFLR